MSGKVRHLLIQVPYFLLDKVSDILDLFRNYEIVHGEHVKGRWNVDKSYYMIRVYKIQYQHACFLEEILKRVYDRNQVIECLWVDEEEE